MIAKKLYVEVAIIDFLLLFVTKPAGAAVDVTAVKAVYVCAPPGRINKQSQRTLQFADGGESCRKFQHFVAVVCHPIGTVVFQFWQRFERRERCLGAGRPAPLRLAIEVDREEKENRKSGEQKSGVVHRLINITKPVRTVIQTACGIPRIDW